MLDNQVSEWVRSTQFDATVKLLSQTVKPDDIFALVDDARTLTLQLMNSVERKSGLLACAVGCHFCCYLMATVSAPEALTIAHRVRETMSPAELDDLRQRLERACRQTRDMDDWARIRAGIPCPFLADVGTCAIYANRPLDCVTYHSLSRQACEDVLAEPGRGHPTHAGLQAIGIGIKTGLGQGLATAKLERPALRYELIEAMHIGLNDERAMTKYLAGENIFKPAAIVIDPERGRGHKMRSAPPHLRAWAKRVLASEQRKASRDRQAKR